MDEAKGGGMKLEAEAGQRRSQEQKISRTEV